MNFNCNCFACRPDQAKEALEESQDKTFFGSKIKVEVHVGFGECGRQASILFDSCFTKKLIDMLSTHRLLQNLLQHGGGPIAP